jgi:hypothetical protein
MKEEEKELLKTLVHSNEGMLSRDVFTGGKNRKLSQRLIAFQFVEEFQYKNLPTYRATEKGLMVFEPVMKRAWHFFSNDMAKILSILATLLSVASMIIALIK